MSLASQQSILKYDEVWILNISQYFLRFYDLIMILFSTAQNWGNEFLIDQRIFYQFQAVEKKNHKKIITNIMQYSMFKIDWWDAKDIIHHFLHSFFFSFGDNNNCRISKSGIS